MGSERLLNLYFKLFMILYFVLCLLRQNQPLSRFSPRNRSNPQLKILFGFLQNRTESSPTILFLLNWLDKWGYFHLLTIILSLWRSLLQLDVAVFAQHLPHGRCLSQSNPVAQELIQIHILLVCADHLPALLSKSPYNCEYTDAGPLCLWHYVWAWSICRLGVFGQVVSIWFLSFFRERAG